MDRQAPDIMKNRDATLKRIEDMRAEQERLTGGFGILQAIAPTRDEEDRSKKASDIQDQIQQLQKMLADAEASTKRSDLHAGKEETDRIRARFFGTHDGMEKAYADAKKDVERLQKQLLEPDKPLTKSQAQDLDQQLHAAQANETRRKAALDAVTKGAEQLKEFQRQAAEFEKKGDEAELDAIGKIYYQRDQLLKQAAQVKASEKEIAAIRKSAEEQASVIYKKSWEEFEKYDEKQMAARSKRMLALMLPSKDQMKEWEEYFAAQEKIEDIGVQAQREEARRRAARSGRMAELTAGQETPVAMSEAEKRELADRKEVAAAQQAYQTRLDLAVQLAGIEAERISKEENAAKRSVLAAQAQKDLFTELAQAQDQFEEKQAQIQQKRQQEIQSQIDGLQKQAERPVRRPVHQAQELRQGSAQYDPRRGAQARHGNAGRRGGECAASDHLRVGRAERHQRDVARHVAGPGAGFDRPEHGGDHAEQRGDGQLDGDPRRQHGSGGTVHVGRRGWCSVDLDPVDFGSGAVRARA